MSRALVSSLFLLTSLSAGSGYAQVPDDPKVDLGAAATGAPAARSVDGGVAAAPVKPSDAKFTPTPVVSAPTGSPADKQKWLQQQIDAVLHQPSLGATRVGIDVVEVESGKRLYSRNDAG